VGDELISHTKTGLLFMTFSLNSRTKTMAVSGYEEEAGNLVLQNIRDAYVLVNAEKTVVYCNDVARESVRRFFGIELSPGFNLLDLVAEDRREKIAEIHARSLQGKEHRTESSFTLANGSVIYFENVFQPALDHLGQIVGVIICSKNITQRKKAQQTILESEARLQFALEATHQGAWDWNLTTNEVIYSSSYKKLYGFSDGDLKNHVSEWMTRIHPEDLAKMQQSVNENLQAPDPVYESQYRIRAKDGEYRWVAAKGLLLYDPVTGKPTRMVGTHTDITEKIEQEATLKQINERLECVMKATHELVWEWDIVNDSTSYSESGLQRVYGVANEKSIEKFKDWLPHVHPDDREKVSDTLLGMLHKSHLQTFEMEYRFRRDDGSYAHVYDRGILLKDENERPIRMIGSAQDISERKRLEKELLENELQYQRIIHQTTIDSQERERAEIGKELHDNINQVLTTTKLYLDLAQTNAELKDELLAKSMDSINQVIQEIRHLSRSLMNSSIDDLGLLDSVQDLIENIHLTQQLRIRLKADDKIEALLEPGQKLAVFRIIQESINNVLRHARADNALIEISRKNDCLQLCIQDDGQGFSIKSVKKGVGLKNIQNRIYLINGTLQLQSEPGQGCQLTIQFPIKNS
jgi:PAS domain S-box-containing protein